MTTLEAKRAALAEIEDAEGRLTPEAVVQAAAALDSPLHGEFIWDDSEAAHRFRLSQARTLIRSIRYDEKVEVQVVAAPMYVRDPAVAEHSQGYRAVTHLREDPDDARAAMVRELACAAAALRRARKVAQVLGFAKEVDDLVESVVRLQGEAAPPPS